MPRVTIGFKESNSKKLILEIQSHLQQVRLEAVEPFWSILEQSEFDGQFLVVITRKVQGAHEQGPLVKVIGLASVPFLVSVKFQSSSEYCYEATLSGKKNAEEGGLKTIPASIVNQGLQKIAGTSWFNPNNVGVKKLTVPTSPRPLVSVGSAVMSAASTVQSSRVDVSSDVKSLSPQVSGRTAVVIVTEPHKPTSAKNENQQSKKSTHGLSKDIVFVRSVFEEIAKKVVSSEVTSEVIAKAIVKQLGKEMSRKGCTPIATAWVDKGWLQRQSKVGTIPARYSITDLAVKELRFDVDPAKVVQSSDSGKLSATSAQPPAHQDLIQALGLVEQKAQKFVDARKRSDELELHKMQLEDDLKAVQKELEGLRPILEDSELRKAAELLSNLTSFKHAVV